VREEIRDLQRQLGLTAVYVTHDQSEAMAVSDHIIVMNQARIAQQGSPADLYRAPASRFIANFIGEANFAAARRRRGADGGAAVELVGLTIAMSDRNLRDGPVLLAIRPESIRISAPGALGLAGRVTRALFLGDHMEYNIETAVGSLFVLGSDVDRPWPVGAEVQISFRQSGLAVIPSDGS